LRCTAMQKAATAWHSTNSSGLRSRTADALLQWSKSRMLGAAGKGPLPQHRRNAFAADVPSMAAIR